MARTTVGAVLQALQIIAAKKKEALKEGKKSGNYGKTFSAYAGLREVLANCEVKIDLPDDVACVVVPLLLPKV